MSNPNKHKPLSPEELFKLLDKESNKASDFDELDDFEREALEGFSAHSDSKQAKALTEELNLAISQKASGIVGKDEKKNRVLWFSAAASIVVIVMISVFFFNQSKEESQNAIVLNELKEEEKPVLSEAGSVPPLQTISENANNNSATGKTDNRAEEIAKLLQTDEVKKEETVAGLTNEHSITFSENKPVVSPAEVADKDEAKRRENDDEMQKKQPDGFAGKSDSKDKSNNTNLEQETSSDITLAADRLATNAAPQKVAVSTTSKGAKENAEKSKNSTAKKSAEKQKASKEQVTADVKSYGTVGFTQSSPAASEASTTLSTKSTNEQIMNAGPAANRSNVAYYTGSESAIRNYVLNYVKEHKPSRSVAGHYKVMGIVSAEGKLTVSSIVQTTKVNCLCEDIITEALNTTTQWNVPTENGKKVSSKVEFTIAF